MPSELLKIEDDWAAYQVDNAVCLIGSAIDGAKEERHKVGPEDNPTWELKYTMRQLLDPEFKLPVSQSMGYEDNLDAKTLALMDGLVYDEVR